ncbi:YiiX/YebB-like N1pC/P60 family cysteine hydrolase [Formosa sp. 3Alg 14/1]|uniref:YiiX/YebB-like N1pC/P60 family cysteine hydrolase n=1 Tax=Formosa sp. 3Alg 14/1 TaxID=3382190 RepID=UPI0039BDE635
MTNSYYLLSILLAISLINSCKQGPEFSIQEGDLLFQDVDCGPFCESIEAVTEGVNQYNFSHVGLVMESANGDLKVMEAVSAGVVLTPIDSFLNRSLDAFNKPKVVVGRVKPQLSHLIPEAISFIHTKMNAEYDPYFDIDNDKYYCSELIHLAFKAANNNEPIFKEQPMTFKSPETNKTFAIWEVYFRNLDYDIPEGQPGLNPGGMSRSSYINIVHHYGTPSKKVAL